MAPRQQDDEQEVLASPKRELFHGCFPRLQREREKDAFRPAKQGQRDQEHQEEWQVLVAAIELKGSRKSPN